MSISKRAFVAASAAVLTGLSTGAVAQQKGNAKSSQVTTVGEGEAVMIGPKGQRLHKSNVKVTAAQHEAAMKKGAKEIKAGTVIYKQGGKLYMMEGGPQGGFQSNFDIDY
jgi:hypothetical protein